MHQRLHFGSSARRFVFWAYKQQLHASASGTGSGTSFINTQFSNFSIQCIIVSKKSTKVIREKVKMARSTLSHSFPLSFVPASFSLHCGKERQTEAASRKLISVELVFLYPLNPLSLLTTKLTARSCCVHSLPSTIEICSSLFTAG